MAHCLTAKPSYGIHGHPPHMRTGIVMEELQTFAINQYWRLLHTSQLLRVHVRSDRLAHWLQLIVHHFSSSPRKELSWV